MCAIFFWHMAKGTITIVRNEINHYQRCIIYNVFIYTYRTRTHLVPSLLTSFVAGGSSLSIRVSCSCPPVAIPNNCFSLASIYRAHQSLVISLMGVARSFDVWRWLPGSRTCNRFMFYEVQPPQKIPHSESMTVNVKRISFCLFWRDLSDQQDLPLDSIVTEFSIASLTAIILCSFIPLSENGNQQNKQFQMKLPGIHAGNKPVEKPLTRTRESVSSSRKTMINIKIMQLVKSQSAVIVFGMAYCEPHTSRKHYNYIIIHTYYYSNTIYFNLNDERN